MHWPALLPDEIDQAWDDLRDWVELAVERFRLDARTIPPCWYRHNPIVETLSALRDYEYDCYASDAPTAAIDWLRVLREATYWLTEWAARSGCTATEHRDNPGRQPIVNDEAWSEFVATDRQRRDQILHEAEPQDR